MGEWVGGVYSAVQGSRAAEQQSSREQNTQSHATEEAGGHTKGTAPSRTVTMARTTVVSGMSAVMETSVVSPSMVKTCHNQRSTHTTVVRSVKLGLKTLKSLLGGRTAFAYLRRHDVHPHRGNPLHGHRQTLLRVPHLQILLHLHGAA
jgi:hypothetical protein